jgi:hypothetical protein
MDSNSPTEIDGIGLVFHFLFFFLFFWVENKLGSNLLLAHRNSTTSGEVKLEGAANSTPHIGLLQGDRTQPTPQPHQHPDTHKMAPPLIDPALFDQIKVQIEQDTVIRKQLDQILDDLNQQVSFTQGLLTRIHSTPRSKCL